MWMYVPCQSIKMVFSVLDALLTLTVYFQCFVAKSMLSVWNCQLSISDLLNF